MRRPAAVYGGMAVVVFALVLGITRLGWPGSWPDEGFSIAAATGQAPAAPEGTFTPEDVWKHNTLPNVLDASARIDNGNGIAYTILLHWWIQAFGPSNMSVRLPSALFVAGATGVVYSLVAGVAPVIVAAVAAGLTAASPMLVRAGKIARPNAMAAFLAILSVHLLFRILRVRDAKRRLGLSVLHGAISALAFFTHYFTAFVTCGEALFVGVLLTRGDERISALARPLVASLGTAIVVAAVFLSIGGLAGLRSGAAQEQIRLINATSSATGAVDTYIVASHENVIKHLRLLLANLFPVRSAAADTPWLTSRAIVAGLLAFTLATVVVCGAGFIAAARHSGTDESLLLLLCTVVLATGVIGVVLASAVVMGTIVPFVPRSNVGLVPAAAIVTAFIIRGLWRWPVLMRYAALTVLAAQILVFNAVTLRQVFVPRYAEAGVRLPTGTQQTVARILALYRPGDLVEYDQWLDAAKVNIYLRGANVAQHVRQNGAPSENRPRSIVLTRADGSEQLLWRGTQDNGALLPYYP